MPHQPVNNTSLHYEITGQGDPVLLIHGLGSSTRDWADQVAALQDHFQVIAVDVRGHGQSEKPPGPYSVPLFASDIAALLRTLDTGPTYVAGISMGGMIGLQLALDAPELVRRLIVINSGSEVVIHTFRDRFNVWLRFAILRVLGMKGMGKFLAGRLFPDPGQEDLQAVFVARWAENDPRAYRDAMRALVGWTVTARLQEIGCPVLILSSEFDYSPTAEKERLFAALPDHRVEVIAQAHHAVTVEYPNAVNEALLGFLR